MFSKWSYNETHECYVGGFENTAKLPPGRYRLGLDGWGENPQVSKEHLKDDQLCLFEFGPMQAVRDEAMKFWGCAEHYKALGVTHKRSFLLHGAPGCGKSTIISALTQDTIKNNGLVCPLSNIRDFKAAFPLLRQIEPDRNVLIVIEDLDNLCGGGWEEHLLELLDGSTSIGHGLLYVSTTNYLQNIPERLRCRPSRIDTVIEIPLPDEKIRLAYLKFICKGTFERPEAELFTWAEASDGFSLAGVKELVISQLVYQLPMADAVAKIRELENVDAKEAEANAETPTKKVAVAAPNSDADEPDYEP